MNSQISIKTQAEIDFNHGTYNPWAHDRRLWDEYSKAWHDHQAEYEITVFQLYRQDVCWPTYHGQYATIEEARQACAELCRPHYLGDSGDSESLYIITPVVKSTKKFIPR